MVKGGGEGKVCFFVEGWVFFGSLVVKGIMFRFYKNIVVLD